MAHGETYEQFVEKFKSKKTTDDCYTPEPVYNAVLDWVVQEYGTDRTKVIRPFYPGCDYQAEEYPAGYTVVDNPPFSILSKIIDWYLERDIKFFLFAPALTCFSIFYNRKVSIIVPDVKICYENDAIVSTAFVTNLDTCAVRTAPDLSKILNDIQKETKQKNKKTLPRYKYPDAVLTAAMLRRIADVDYRVERKDCKLIKTLDSQREMHKGIFGAGLLLSEKAAAEKAAAEKAVTEKAAAEKAAAEICWELSKREKEVIASLG